MEDLTFAGEKIIFNTKPQHRLQMPPQDRRGNQVGNLCNLVAPSLDGMQGIETYFLSLLSLCFQRVVPLRNPRIKVPAVVVDTFPSCLEVGQQLRDAGQI